MMKYLYLLLASFFLTPLVGQNEIPEIDWTALQKTKPWEATEQWTPLPAKVVPGHYHTAPSDAIVLFEGSNLNQWCKPQYLSEGANIDQLKAAIEHMDHERTRVPADWTIQDGAFVVKPGSGAIETIAPFGDIQLHIEWLSPTDPGKEGQAYSNSGIFFMGLYEIQVLNSHSNSTYPNGQAGAIYKQHLPLVNASRPSGEWQAYDIVFTAPIFKNGQLKSPAYITAFHNGVLIQNHVELAGPTVYIGQSEYTPHMNKMPLRLQDHGDLVRYRNIWVREL